MTLFRSSVRLATFCIAIIASTLSAAPATAGVVYNWVELDRNADLGPVTGRLVVRDDVWRLGSWSAEMSGAGPTSMAAFGLESFYAYAPAMGRALEAGPAQCIDHHPNSAEFCDAIGLGPEGLVISGPLGLGFDLDFGDLLSGRIGGAQSGSEGYASFYSEFGMPISLIRAGRDGPFDAPCGATECEARGVWLIDRSTIPVPEPGSLALVVAALSGFAATRRKVKSDRLSRAASIETKKRRSLMRLRLGVLLSAALVVAGQPAHAALVTGYFNGQVLGNMNFIDPATGELLSREISSESARLSFSYETALAPVPELSESCPASSCTYASGDEVHPDLVTWLYVAFDFGEFRGSSVPATSTVQRVRIANGPGDELEVAMRSDWSTTFGPMTNQPIPVFALAPEETFDSTSLLQTTRGVVEAGGGSAGPRRVRGLFPDSEYGWEVEFDFRVSSLRVWVVSEPPFLALFALALIGPIVALRRERGTNAVELLPCQESVV